MNPVLALVSLATGLAAQSTWYQHVLAVNPPPRDTHELAAEPISGKVVLFGGVLANNAGQLNDTWEWGGNAWVQIQPQASPSPREHHAMAPDGQGGVVLFGGMSFSSGLLNDTWRYAQGQWTRVFPGNSPAARRAHNMELAGTRIVLFGGSDIGVNFADTWEWDGTNWNQTAPAHSPLPRSGHGMAHDASRHRVVLWGGQANGGGAHSDTWEWDGADWQQSFPANSPPTGYYFSLAYHPGLAKSVLYGGYHVSGTGVPFCWTWDGSNWTSVTLSPQNPGPRGTPLAYSPASQGLILFGGLTPTPGSLGDTWISLPSTPVATYSAFGVGCPGTGGIPSLAPVGSEVPRLGTTSHLRAANLSTNVHVVIMVIGLSTTQNSGPLGTYPLPFDLTAFGLPGCQQFVASTFTHFLLSLTGQVDWPLTVPMDPGLAGTILHVQALSHESPALAAVSNAVTATVGY